MTPSTRQSGGVPAADAEPFSIIRLASVVLRYTPLIAACGFAAMVVGLALAILIPHTYTATTTFVSNANRSAPALSGLAAQFGVALPVTTGGQSPDFYLDLIGSREILKRVALSKYARPGRTDSGTLAQVIPIPGKDSLQQLLSARGFLSAAVHPSLSVKTGLISIAVTTREPWLSTAIAANLLTAVDEFNRRTQRERAEGERRFAETRLEAARKDLEASEAELQHFRQTNRSYNATSEMALEEQRLTRQISLKQALYLSLAQSFEQARMESERDLSQITIIEPPELPFAPDSRTTIRRALFAAMLGAMAAILYMIVREYFLRSRERSNEEVEEFVTTARTMARSLRSPSRLIGRDKDEVNRAG